MDVLDLMQRALDKTNDPDAIFALDRGITEIERLRDGVNRFYGNEPTGLMNEAADKIERLREALKSISKIPNSEAAYGIIQTFVVDARKEKE